jgi:hypothetical protein
MARLTRIIGLDYKGPKPVCAWTSQPSDHPGWQVTGKPSEVVIGPSILEQGGVPVSLIPLEEASQHTIIEGYMLHCYLVGVFLARSLKDQASLDQIS